MTKMYSDISNPVKNFEESIKAYDEFKKREEKKERKAYMEILKWREYVQLMTGGDLEW